ncbi:MAG: hypothetical protein HY675_25785, partial [Chloroflexi bacterium]|nr:hypothetical protein [Chloroflexota bacterium]
EFVWMDDCPPFDGRCTPPPLPVHADPAALEDVARQLVSAKRPVLVTGSAGRDTRNVAILVELAERLAMPVVEAGPDFLNFPRGHQLHQGFNADQLMNEADVVVLVATQLPWYPASRRPGNAKIIQIDDDPSNERLPYWGFQVDVVIPGELNSTLQQLNALVAKLDTASVSVADARKERLAELAGRQEKSREDARSKALALSNNHPMSSLFAAQVIGEELPQNVALVEETITQKGMVLRHVVRNLPGTACRAPGGGLGKGMGLALGLKVADPDRPVALIVGDGSFYYNPVPAAFGFAQQYNAPILVIIMDNRGYGSEKDDIVRLYPDGYSVRTGTFLGSLIEPTPDYAGFAQAFGGYGERVEDPQELRGAIRRALEQVNAGRLALLDLFVQP